VLVHNFRSVVAGACQALLGSVPHQHPPADPLELHGCSSAAQAKEESVPRSLELFAGGGGLATGLHLAGFEHLALVEWEQKACATLLRNAERSNGKLWELDTVIHGDVRDFLRGLQTNDRFGEVELVAGGPPCQPFSLGGLHAGHSDGRNMFPAALDIVRQVRPMAVIFENVPGLLRPSFLPYFEYVLAQLAEPTVTPREGEDWRDHYARVTTPRRGSRSLRYRVRRQLINAANVGVPQLRRRVFVVAIRDDLGVEWDHLPLTHSEDALVYDQWIEPTYWEEHGVPQPPVPDSIDPNRLHELKFLGRPAGVERWRTVRDLLRGLPEPVDGKPHPTVLNHIGIPGARSYPGHTGSPMDLPAKTLKAGVHGVCGGEAMIRFPDGRLRYMTVRESARAQGFPDRYEFLGARSHAMRHIGNAVAVGVAEAVGRHLRNLCGF
jgi:DNA (cytosine-5)-methyltransferase 1